MSGRIYQGLAASAMLLSASFVAQAALITPGFTYAVASSSVGGVGSATTGGHFHSNTGGSFGNPAGLAEVGEFGGTSDEEVRGLSEYDLTGLVTGPAFVSFDVFQAGGLFTGVNDFPFDGNIDIVAYQGNNLEDISDFQAASVGAVGSFATTALVIGNTLSFDITSIYNDAVSNGWSSLGIRLQTDPTTDPNGGAWVFNDFRLTSTDDTTAVPEPMTFALLGLGLAGLSFSRRNQR